MSTESGKNTAAETTVTNSEKSWWKRVLSYLPEERHAARKSISVESGAEVTKYHPYM